MQMEQYVKTRLFASCLMTLSLVQKADHAWRKWKHKDERQQSECLVYRPKFQHRTFRTQEHARYAALNTHVMLHSTRTLCCTQHARYAAFNTHVMLHSTRTLCCTQHARYAALNLPAQVSKISNNEINNPSSFF
jgi:hypothetical protein